MDKREAIKKVMQYKLLLGNHFDLESVYLFGSFANDTNKEDSDIDVAVIVKNISGDYFAINPIALEVKKTS